MLPTASNNQKHKNNILQSLVILVNILQPLVIIYPLGGSIVALVVDGAFSVAASGLHEGLSRNFQSVGLEHDSIECDP